MLIEAAEAIRKGFWLDDELSGADTLKNAIIKAKLIHATLMQAKFPLRKYVSNSKEFLTEFLPEQVEKLRPVSSASSGTVKILGLQWYPEEDEFRISFKAVDLSNVKLTKQVVASLIARVFDPLGLVSPILIRGKILLQDLWREGLQWTDPIPNQIVNRFQDYYNDLEKLAQVRISRPYSTFVPEERQLIGFCDASEKAYGAVVYIKSHNSTDVIVTIACSKSKVAPLKPLTIPRLELLGEALLAKLVETVATTLKCNTAQTEVFCDSTVALAWLKGPASKYETFVHNTVEFVNSILPYSQWKYINTKENPADLFTRGC